MYDSTNLTLLNNSHANSKYRIKGAWTIEEDQLLINFVNKHGTNKWQQAFQAVPGRTGKQCKSRWLNNLDPNLKKQQFTQEEDQILFQKYHELGPKWISIAKFLPGRSENSVKNRFHCTIRKMKLNQEQQDQKQNKTQKQTDISLKQQTVILLQSEEHGNRNEQPEKQKDNQDIQMSDNKEQIIEQKQQENHQNSNNLKQNNQECVKIKAEFIESRQNQQQENQKNDQSQHQEIEQQKIIQPDEDDNSKNSKTEQQQLEEQAIKTESENAEIQNDYITNKLKEGVSLEELQNQARSHYLKLKRQRNDQTQQNANLFNSNSQQQSSSNFVQYNVYKKLKQDAQKIISQENNIQQNQKQLINQPIQITQPNQFNLLNLANINQQNAQQQINYHKPQNIQQQIQFPRVQNVNDNMYWASQNENQMGEELQKAFNLIQQYQSTLPIQMQRPIPQITQIPPQFQNVNNNLIADLGIPNFPKNVDMLSSANQKLLIMINWAKKLEVMLQQTKKDMERLENEHFNNI